MRRVSMRRIVTLGVLITLVALTGGMTAAQAPPGPIEEMVLLNNDSVRLVLVTYQPGADSDLHLNVGPEVTIVQEGELVLFAQGRREVIRPGGAQADDRDPRGHGGFDEVLGVHIIGTGATELLHIGQAVFGLGGGLDYFLSTVFNYPTLAECYKVSALNAANKLAM